MKNILRLAYPVFGLLVSGCAMDTLPLEAVDEDVATGRSALTLPTDGVTGTNNGFFYSFWKDSAGTVNYTLDANGRYTANWSGINNWVGGKGWSTGNASRTVTFSGSFNPGSNGYLTLYGWTRSSLIEYYVVENYAWEPPGSGATSGGTFTSDGSTYKLWRTQRVQQPSIDGIQTFYQYWSVRSSKRSSGTITFANHVNAWRSKGWNLGSSWAYQIMATEGYQSSGSSDITVSEGGTCTPTTCAALGATCGSPSNGCGGTLSCGTCGSGQTCNSSTFTCQSTCTPTTCAALGATCGSPSNGCGGTLSCGTCSSGQTCNTSTWKCETSSTPPPSGSPCSAYCTNPTTFSSASYVSGNLGPNATCHQTTAALAKINCGNFASGRTLKVNGTTVTCNWNEQNLPAMVNNGYCIQSSAGQYDWAQFQTR